MKDATALPYLKKALKTESEESVKHEIEAAINYIELEEPLPWMDELQPGRGIQNG